MEQEKQWYERILNDTSNKRIYFTVCDISSNDAIGFMFLDDIDFIHRRCVCGGAIGDTNLIGKGYGREAVGLLLSYAFKSLNLRRVYAYVMKDHPALKTWLATGAIIEAVLKEYSWVNGAHKDVCILSWEKSYL